VEKFSINQLIDGIRKKDNKVLTYIYRKFYPYIQSFIINNSGSEEDAKDTFQEALITLYNYSMDESFIINESFKAFLYSICKNIWFKQLRSKQIHNKSVSELNNPVTLDPTVEEHIEEELEMKIYRKHFQALDHECQQVLEKTNRKQPYDEIAHEMGFKNEKYVRNRRFRCKEHLISLIKKDPEYVELMKHRKGS
jgi:RNA polymerase sigma factor (sigma-70 family)